jgi:microcystin degradation protein MlrC
MKRLMWLGVGLAIGGLVVRAVGKKARSYSPSGVAATARDSGRNLLDAVRDFVDDVRDGMQERERQLQAAFLDGATLAAADDWFDHPPGGGPGEPGRRPASYPPEATT